jgi:hypothetical protein
MIEAQSRVTLTPSGSLRFPEITGSGIVTRVWEDGKATVIFDRHGAVEIPVEYLTRSAR